MQENYAAAEKKYNEMCQEIKSTEGTIEGLKKAVSEAEDLDLQELLQRQQLWEKEREEFSRLKVIKSFKLKAKSV